MFRPNRLHCSLQGVFNTVSVAAPAPAPGASGGGGGYGYGCGDGGPSRHRAAGMHQGSTFSQRMVQFLRDKHARGGAAVRHYEYVQRSKEVFAVVQMHYS
jgi:hypothetical protein